MEASACSVRWTQCQTLLQHIYEVGQHDIKLLPDEEIGIEKVESETEVRQPTNYCSSDDLQCFYDYYYYQVKEMGHEVYVYMQFTEWLLYNALTSKKEAHKNCSGVQATGCTLGCPDN